MRPLAVTCWFNEPVCLEVCVCRPVCVSYQDEQAVRGEFLVSRDGGEHRENQTAKHQDETVETRHASHIKDKHLVSG